MPAGSSHVDHHPGAQITGELVVEGQKLGDEVGEMGEVAHLRLGTGEGALPQAVRQVPNGA